MQKPSISFEFFPPKSLDGSFQLWDSVQKLAPFSPEFVSVTYGAGGSTRKLTHEAVELLQNNYDLPVAAHLTCVDATRQETLDIATAYAKAGVREIVALRGDPPNGHSQFEPAENGFASSIELISALADLGQFNIRVGAYPNRHPEAKTDTSDVDWLKRKIDAGAHSAITQFFFDADTFFRFRDRCAKAGINAEIIPGILPIENWIGVKNFAKRCGAAIPSDLDDAFSKAIRDDRHDLLAISQATELCSDLAEGGVGHLHFYTLNKPTLTREILCALGHAPKKPMEKVA